MSYNQQRVETLRRLGIEQLPALYSLSDSEDEEPIEPLGERIPVRQMPVPGRRCPACLDRGTTVWVLPGKRCPTCGTAVN